MYNHNCAGNRCEISHLLLRLNNHGNGDKHGNSDLNEVVLSHIAVCFECCE